MAINAAKWSLEDMDLASLHSWSWQSAYKEVDLAASRKAFNVMHGNLKYFYLATVLLLNSDSNA